MLHKKRLLSAALFAALTAAMLSGCAQTASAENAPDASDSAAAAALIADIPTTQAFTDDAVPEDDIDTILFAGINAPSAMNGQNWHFTAVTDAEVLQQISDGMSGAMPNLALPSADNTAAADADTESESDAPSSPPSSDGKAKAGITDAPLAIIVSCAEGSEFDAGLACQNMSAEAQLLGYGTKIISSPTIALNGEEQETYRELLGIPDDQSAVAVLLVGTEDTSLDADAVTAATTRFDTSETVTKVAP